MTELRRREGLCLTAWDHGHRYQGLVKSWDELGESTSNELKTKLGPRLRLVQEQRNKRAWRMQDRVHGWTNELVNQPDACAAQETARSTFMNQRATSEKEPHVGE